MTTRLTDNRFYFVSAGALNTVEVYDPETNKWSPVQRMIIARSTHAVAGKSDTAPDFSCTRYDLFDCPHVLACLQMVLLKHVILTQNVRFHSTAASVSGGKLYALGGAQANCCRKSCSHQIFSLSRLYQWYSLLHATQLPEALRLCLMQEKMVVARL